MAPAAATTAASPACGSAAAAATDSRAATAARYAIDDAASIRADEIGSYFATTRSAASQHAAIGRASATADGGMRHASSETAVARDTASGGASTHPQSCIGPQLLLFSDEHRCTARTRAAAAIGAASAREALRSSGREGTQPRRVRKRVAEPQVSTLARESRADVGFALSRCTKGQL